MASELHSSMAQYRESGWACLKRSSVITWERHDLNIQRLSDEPNCATFSLSGRVQTEDLVQLCLLLMRERSRIVLDLKGVTLVDGDVARFLAGCESGDCELRNCPPFVREWILRQERTEST